jgi:predicted AlkP superfamily phosphohydrolase/phosphomutase
MRALFAERPTDFFLGVFHLPDRICHAALNLTGLPLDPDRDELSAGVARFFHKLDKYLGALAEDFARRNDLLAIISDHGFAPSSRWLNLNTWLIKKGFLQVRSMRTLPARVINKRKLAAVLQKVGLFNPVMKHTPRALRRIVPAGDGGGARASIVDLIEAGKVDWENTLAVSLPNHGIYLNASDRPLGRIGVGAEREAILEEMRRELLALEIPASGERPVSAVHRREELYDGPRVGHAPDLVVEMVEGWSTKASIDEKGSLVVEGGQADHRREGIFLLIAEGIPPQGGLTAHIEDMAPTFMAYMGVEEHPPMDGRSIF